MYKISIYYSIDGVNKVKEVTAKAVTAQMDIQGSTLTFVDGKDKTGPLEWIIAKNIWLIEKRPIEDNDDNSSGQV